MKEIKVKLYRHEDDSYVELWKVLSPQKGEPKYYGRYTYGNSGTWYTIHDPHGYCEMGSPVSNDVMFLLCDEKGEEYFRYSNADENPLPKLETVVSMEWDKIKDSIQHNTENHTADFWAESLCGETVLGINQWLLTFKDPDLYKQEIDAMHGYDENWIYCRTRQVRCEPIPGTEFSYLGKKYQFTKVTCWHTVCGAKWIEYKCTDSPCKIDKWIGKVVYYYDMGNWYDSSNIGTMYDRRTARNVVINALEEIYPKVNDNDELLYVKQNGCAYLEKKSYGKAAEALLGNDLHRDKVLDIIKTEREEHHFYQDTEKNRALIERLYPNICY